jgi:hypothetical protein
VKVPSLSDGLFSFACFAIAVLSGSLLAQQTSNCVYTTRGNTAEAECIQNDANCPDCCLHYHQTLNWDSCTIDGDQKKDTTTPKHFQAITRTCTLVEGVHICSGPSPAAECEHKKMDCSVIECD